MDLALPTDSLYKFVSLAGLLLVVLAIYLLVSLWRQYLARHDQLSFTADIGIDNANRLTSLLNSVKERQVVSVEELQSYFQQVEGLRDARTEFNAAIAILNKWERRVRWLTVGLAVVLIVGTATTVVGFRFWYERLQQYDDMVVRSRAETALRGADSIQQQPSIPDSLNEE